MSCVLFREKPILKAAENLCGVAEAQHVECEAPRYAGDKIRILVQLFVEILDFCTLKSDTPLTGSGFVRIVDILKEENN